MNDLPHAGGELTVDLSRQVRAVQRKSENAGRKQRKMLTAADKWRTNDLVNLVR